MMHPRQKVRQFAQKLISEGELSMKLGKEINWALDQLDQAVQSNIAKDQQIAALQQQVNASQATTQDQEDKDAIARLDTTFNQNNSGATAAPADTVASGPGDAGAGTTNVTVNG